MLGQWGEERARQHLQSKGYILVTQNYRSRTGEIDIVALEGNVVVFVEVKTRRGSAFGSAEESISETRANRLVEMAEEFLASQSVDGYDSHTLWRIDLLCLTLDLAGRVTAVNHIKHAVEF